MRALLEENLHQLTLQLAQEQKRVNDLYKRQEEIKEELKQHVMFLYKLQGSVEVLQGLLAATEGTCEARGATAS